METNDNRDEKKNNRSSLFIGVVAGMALAAALGGAFMLGARGDSESADAREPSSVGQPIGDVAADDNADGANADNGSAYANDGGVVDEPTVAPQEPEAEDPTATPTSTPTSTPANTPTATATPDDECAFCPDGLDLGVKEPVVPPCGGDCAIDGGLIVELPGLAFEQTQVSFCEGLVAISAEITGHGEIWVTYSKEWGVTIESEHQFPESFFLGETATWGWFGGWGWIYPIDFVFHAEDTHGNHIEQEVSGDYVC